MDFKFIPMTLDYANIIKTWEYDGYLKNIYMEPYFKNYDKTTGRMKGPGGCEGFAVLNIDKLIGLFEYYFTDGIMEIGLALNPETVGKGLGKKFIEEGIKFGIERFNYNKDFIKISVNSENKPAIKVYEKVGFKEYMKNEDEIEMRFDINE